MTRGDGVVANVRAVAGTASDERVTFLAAGVAYYAFVSLVPLLLLVLAVGSLVGGEGLANAVVDRTGSLLAESGQELVRGAVTNAAGRGTATVVGTALLLWSGLKLFRGLDLAFSDVYGVAAAETLLDQVRDGLIVLVAIGLAAVAVVGIGGVVPILDLLPFSGLLVALGLPVVLAVVFLPVYYVFPDVDVSLSEVVPGTVFAAVGWTVLVELFGVYAANAGQFELYGVLGGVLLLVTWFYLAAIIIILGAVVNAVLAGRTDGDAGESDETGGDGAGQDLDGPAPDVRALGREVRRLSEQVEERTVSRSDLEAELRAYVRQRVRRGHARGWGPYLVLLYGTAMTVAAYYFLSGGWAILAMIVVWLSTLGLYTLMLLVGAGLGLLGAPGRLAGWISSLRE